MLSLTAEEIESLIRRTIAVEKAPSTRADSLHQSLVIGALMHGVSSLEDTVLEIASGRMGYRSVKLGWEDIHSMSDEDIIWQAQMYSTAIDLLVTGYVDSDTSGSGRQMTEAVRDAVSVPVISVADDVYAPQSALAVIAAIWKRLGGLKGKRLAISWGFGSRYVLPTTANSLILFCASLGANLRVVSPPEFTIQNRVVQDASERAQKSNSCIEEVTEFESAFSDVDAIFAANWCSLHHVQRPERNAKIAAKYRQWYFTEDSLSPNCVFITEPPIQSELLASKEIIAGTNYITQEWFAKRVEALIASISLVMEEPSLKSLI